MAQTRDREHLRDVVVLADPTEFGTDFHDLYRWWTRNLDGRPWVQQRQMAQLTVMTYRWARVR